MYPTTTELVAASSNAALKALEESEQDGLRDEAIIAIESACRQSFTLEGDTGSGSGDEGAISQVLDGTGGDVIYLPRRLVELESLEVPDGSISASDVVLSADHDRLAVLASGSDSTWLTRVMADARARHVSPLCFPAGPALITVSGIWGWAPQEVPAAIATALRYDMEDRAVANAHALADTVRSAKSLGVTGLSQGGLSLQMDGREVAVSARVRRILSSGNLIWHGPAGAVA